MTHTINTKYTFGDKLWTMGNGKVICFTVNAISPFLSDNCTSVSYMGRDAIGVFNEKDCFPTREALRDHVFPTTPNDEE